jgi:hypothetical protein
MNFLLSRGTCAAAIYQGIRPERVAGSMHPTYEDSSVTYSPSSTIYTILIKDIVKDITCGQVCPLKCNRHWTMV